MAEIDLSATPRRWSGWIAVAVVAIILVSVFVGFAVSNHGRMELVVEEGELRLERGRFLPWGTHTWEPSPAFAPIVVGDAEGGVDLPVGPCADEFECEQRFYEATLRLAAHHLAAGDAESLVSARDLIVRAQLFPNIPLEAREPIEDLTGGVHYVEALVELESLRDDLRRVRKKLERSRIAGLEYVDEAELDALIWMVERNLDLMDRELPSDGSVNPAIPEAAAGSDAGPEAPADEPI